MLPGLQRDRRAPEQRDGTVPVATLRMGDADGQLGETAPKLAVAGGGGFPPCLENLVRAEGAARPEQLLGDIEGLDRRKRRGVGFDGSGPAWQRPSERIARSR